MYTSYARLLADYRACKRTLEMFICVGRGIQTCSTAPCKLTGGDRGWRIVRLPGGSDAQPTLGIALHSVTKFIVTPDDVMRPTESGTSETPQTWWNVFGLRVTRTGTQLRVMVRGTSRTNMPYIRPNESIDLRTRTVINPYYGPKTFVVDHDMSAVWRKAVTDMGRRFRCMAELRAWGDELRDNRLPGGIKYLTDESLGDAILRGDMEALYPHINTIMSHQRKWHPNVTENFSLNVAVAWRSLYNSKGKDMRKALGILGEDTTGADNV